MFITSLTVFAYKEPNIVTFEDESFDDTDFLDVRAYSKFGAFEETTDKLPDLDKTESVSYYFIDENNNVSKINNINEKVVCSHVYETGSVTKHYLNANGDCKVEYYDADKCKKCANVVIGTKNNTVTYEKCPH